MSELRSPLAGRSRWTGGILESGLVLSRCAIRRNGGSLSRRVVLANSAGSGEPVWLQSSPACSPARLPAASSPQRPATAASRALCGASRPAPASLERHAVPSALARSLWRLTKTARSCCVASTRAQLGAPEIAVWWPDWPRLLAAALRPLLSALSAPGCRWPCCHRLAAQRLPGAGASRALVRGSARQRLVARLEAQVRCRRPMLVALLATQPRRPEDSPVQAHLAGTARIFSVASSMARLGAPEAASCGFRALSCPAK